MNAVSLPAAAWHWHHPGTPRQLFIPEPDSGRTLEHFSAQAQRFLRAPKRFPADLLHDPVMQGLAPGIHASAPPARRGWLRHKCIYGKAKSIRAFTPVFADDARP